MTVIGIAGKAGAGKDTLANLLVGYYQRDGRIAERRAFADALKDDVGHLLFPGGNREDVENFKHMPEIRTLLQAYGEAQRAFDPEHWIKRVFTYWRRRGDFYGSADNLLLVIPDVRYPNECEAIKQRGGTLVRVERPGVHSPLTMTQQEHRGETQLDDYRGFDFTVVNNGTPDYMLLQFLSKMRQPEILREVMLDDPAVIKFAVKQALKDAVERGEMPASILEALD